MRLTHRDVSSDENSGDRGSKEDGENPVDAPLEKSDESSLTQWCDDEVTFEEEEITSGEEWTINSSTDVEPGMTLRRKRTILPSFPTKRMKNRLSHTTP